MKQYTKKSNTSRYLLMSDYSIIYKLMIQIFNPLEYDFKELKDIMR